MTDRSWPTNPALAELAEARSRLNAAIEACTELGMDYAAVVIAKDQAERERDRLARILDMAGSETAVRLQQATRLLQYAYHLRVHGERAPGGDETWAAFDGPTEAFLRAQAGYSSVRVPENTGKHPGESDAQS